MQNFKVNRRNNSLQLPFSLNQSHTIDERDTGSLIDSDSIAQENINPISDDEIIDYTLKNQSSFEVSIYFVKVLNFKNASQIQDLSELINKEAHQNFLNDYLEEFGESNVPAFANSFVYQYIKNAQNIRNQFEFANKANLFNNEQFFFNSFLKLDFYDSPNLLSQNLLFSQIAYNIPRYLKKQNLGDLESEQYRPSFSFNERTPVYKFEYLKNSNIKNLYVKFSFYDALNGEVVSLIPTTEKNPEKKWVQDPNKFDKKNNFLLYTITGNEFEPFEFNPKTGEFENSVEELELFTLAFNENFANRRTSLFFDSRYAEEKPTKKKIADVGINKKEINGEINVSFGFFVSNKFTINPKKADDNFSQNDLKLTNNGNVPLKLRTLNVFREGDFKNIVENQVETNKWNENNFYRVKKQNYPVADQLSLSDEKLKKLAGDEENNLKFFLLSETQQFIESFNDINNYQIDYTGLYPYKEAKHFDNKIIPFDRGDVNTYKMSREEFVKRYGEQFTVELNTNPTVSFQPGESIEISTKLELGLLYGFFFMPLEPNGNKTLNITYRIEAIFQNSNDNVADLLTQKFTINQKINIT
jgi:hypothetical protein